MESIPYMRYSGDRPRAMGFRRFALTQLKITEDLMKFRDLKQYKRRITLPGGIVITCRVQFGLSLVEIHVPPMIPENPPPSPPRYQFAIIPYWHEMAGTSPDRMAHHIEVKHFGNGAPEIKRQQIMDLYWEFEEDENLWPIHPVDESPGEFLNGTNLGGLGSYTWNYEGNDIVGHSFSIYQWQNYRTFYEADAIEDDYDDIYRSGIALYKDGELQLRLNGIASGFWIAPDTDADPGRFKLFNLKLRYYGYEACSGDPGASTGCMSLTCEWYDFASDGTPTGADEMSQGYEDTCHDLTNDVTRPDRSWVHPWTIMYDPDLDVLVTDCAIFIGALNRPPTCACGDILIKSGWKYEDDCNGNPGAFAYYAGVGAFACGFDPVRRRNVTKYWGHPYEPQFTESYQYEKDQYGWDRLVYAGGNITFVTSSSYVVAGSFTYSCPLGAPYGQYTLSGIMTRFDARIVCYYDWTRQSNQWRFVDRLWIVNGSYTSLDYDPSLSTTILLVDQDGEVLRQTTVSLTGTWTGQTTDVEQVARQAYGYFDWAHIQNTASYFDSTIQNKLRRIEAYGTYCPDKSKLESCVHYRQAYETENDDHENASFEAHLIACPEGGVVDIQLGAMPVQQWRWASNARGINLLPDWLPEAEE